MIYGSLFSGIEAASIAWQPLGWRPAFFSEIDRFPCAVLKHHYPETENRGDVKAFKSWPDTACHVLVGGSPCQSFSVAGLRKGLADPRGNLTLTYLAVADRIRPRWLVWENVPGVLSISGGRVFGAFLAGLAQLGYGFAYRVLDAQFFGVPQRRRRVFVVACLGDWRAAAAVLFERHSLSWHPAPSREARPGAAAGAPARAVGRVGGGDDPGAGKGQLVVDRAVVGPLTVNAGPSSHDSGNFSSNQAVDAGHLVAYGGNDCRGTIGVATAVRAKDGWHQDFESETLIAFDTTQITHAENRSTARPGDPAPTLPKHGHVPAIAFADVADPVAANQADTYTREGSHNFRVSNVAHNNHSVRRLTPTECERLQGFPDGYTAIQYRRKLAKDAPRYKALGNSMAVPVMRWIGERIAAVEAVLRP